ncbi:MAG: hypothetical protein IV094_11415 [Vitreoscilla sp.]|nr:hypothetical protein [Vitreoscilla sp.]
MSGSISDQDIPTSFGTFKPVGHLMLGPPDLARSHAVFAALREAGWPSEDVRHFKPGDTVAELEAMVAGAGDMAGFGYEITMLRRYLELSREGYQWLLVKVSNSERASMAAELARAQGARLAVHYRTLTVEELI